MRSFSLPIALLACSWSCFAAVGGGDHHGDIELELGPDGRLHVGVGGVGGVGGDWGSRVAEGRLDLAAFANLADDPGFESEPGGLPPGARVGLDLLAALRTWDGDSFDRIDPGYAMTVAKGESSVTTPPADARVPGFVFGSADSEGVFHQHVRYFLEPYDPVAQVEGLWLLQFELWSPDGQIGPSEPVYIVFASGPAAVAQQEDAVAWVEANLVGGPCGPADFAEPYGLLDLADIAGFASAFHLGDASADLAEPAGTLDLADITAFVGSFGGGCE